MVDIFFILFGRWEKQVWLAIAVWHSKSPPWAKENQKKEKRRDIYKYIEDWSTLIHTHICIFIYVQVYFVIQEPNIRVLQICSPNPLPQTQLVTFCNQNQYLCGPVNLKNVVIPLKSKGRNPKETCVVQRRMINIIHALFNHQNLKLSNCPCVNVSGFVSSLLQVFDCCSSRFKKRFQTMTDLYMKKGLQKV